jgi:acyl carrier protein
MVLEKSRMNEVVIYERLTRVFENVFDEEPMKLSPTLSAKDVDGWDSLTHVRLMMSVQREFRIKLSAGEMGRLKNVGDLVKLIGERAA